MDCGLGLGTSPIFFLPSILQEEGENAQYQIPVLLKPQSLKDSGQTLEKNLYSAVLANDGQSSNNKPAHSEVLNWTHRF